MKSAGSSRRGSELASDRSQGGSELASCGSGARDGDGGVEAALVVALAVALVVAPAVALTAKPGRRPRRHRGGARVAPGQRQLLFTTDDNYFDCKLTYRPFPTTTTFHHRRQLLFTTDRDLDSPHSPQSYQGYPSAVTDQAHSSPRHATAQLPPP